MNLFKLVLRFYYKNIYYLFTQRIRTMITNLVEVVGSQCFCNLHKENDLVVCFLFEIIQLSILKDTNVIFSLEKI